ncbi:5-dehydro-2-deoxygluconokinase [Legionella sp. MW5194]|uniref:5-dehydro-2-deoxygluconokinase n=1 Tax=Legionella sp. MW5194 TaxID=2662448 RepID=UPI00193E360C|nr:5-dehydro-2-deoxygluconokinase [Legionella sp. MW5194]QRN04098.1 5-dehydro-2-deoxygluconokinase [Legionella sp. MW5194]
MTQIDFVFENNRPVDVIVMGRVAVDLYAEQIGSSLVEAQTFRKYLGGCAGNIAVGAARLGLNSLMFSCVGKDDIGTFLKQTLMQEGVDISLLQESSQHLTGLVLLGIKPPRDFPLMFYRNDCADMQLKPEHVQEDRMAEAKALLITGTGLSTSSMFATTRHAVNVAKKNRTAIIMDLDYRPVLWGLTDRGNGELRYLTSRRVTQTYQQILPHCALVVGTEEEICIAGGKEDIHKALQTIRGLTQAPIVMKRGEKGSEVYFARGSRPYSSQSFPVPVLNVLGAGDGFMAGLLRGLLTGESFDQAMTYANACGALVVTRHGCAPAIPFWPELTYFIRHYADDPEIWASDELAKLHQSLTPTSSPLSETLLKQPQGFKDGLNRIVDMQKSTLPTGMNFSSLRLKSGQTFHFDTDYEFAALLMTGRVFFHYQSLKKEAERTDYFSQLPLVLHCPAGMSAHVEALSDCEILLIETENQQSFAPVFFDETNLLECDHRGKDLLDNTSYRLVRTVFDKRNRPESNLVVGEIITFQGRWSSYPPHAHPQPEIYHYRFSEPQGFAFGENGREVLRIEHNDTFQIAEGQSHAHCTAPGYAMYTLWFIRHQPDNPYRTPTFQSEHEWTRHAGSRLRSWQTKQ